MFVRLSFLYVRNSFVLPNWTITILLRCCIMDVVVIMKG